MYKRTSTSHFESFWSIVDCLDLGHCIAISKAVSKVYDGSISLSSLMMTNDSFAYNLRATKGFVACNYMRLLPLITILKRTFAYKQVKKYKKEFHRKKGSFVKNLQRFNSKQFWKLIKLQLQLSLRLLNMSNWNLSLSGDVWIWVTVFPWNYDIRTVEILLLP